MFRRRDRAARAPVSLRRSFVTPEGIDLRLELASAGTRASAFMIDLLIMTGALILATVLIGLLGIAGARGEIVMILWLVGAFVLRNGWFTLFEMGGRGATPGKRLLGLRVIARDGGRLTGGAVIARNALREVELFLPLSFLGMQATQDAADGFLILFALSWTGIFLFFPLFNRDRLRVGDLLGGTWVVNNVRATLGADLVADRARHERRSFSDAALDLYGIYELQTLEDVLRKGQPDAVATVAATIRRKAGMADDGDDQDFLSDYYAALCARLERGMLVGRRREDKFAAAPPKRSA
ncbi:RDD family protein [Sphingobium chlorophenolicum]|uniref:RDD domain containing protein n=1 Tax=Sphingobium chlorophenolicum TaxID=46429 RepID=A0A081R8W5_SPHCR|nr:RDD family protein [Sphingobium chlorophenolicum]KEQ51638.1 RDD domain containing protein [Sphingobium chlorophenolicum]